VNTTGLDISGTSGTGTSNFLKLGSATSETAGEGIYMDGGGNFRVGTATSGTSYIYYDADTDAIDIKSDTFNLNTTTLDISALGTNKTSRISMGASPPTNFTSNGIILSGSGEFNFQKDAFNFVRHDSNGLKLASQQLNVSGSTTFRLHGNSDGAQIRLGASADSITTTANTGIYMDQAGNFRVGEATSGDNFIYFNGSSVQIKSTNFDLSAGSAGSGELGINTTRIALGSTLPTAYNSGTGFFVNNDGEFLLGAHGGDRIQFGGSGNITIVSSDMNITATTFNLNAGSGKLLLESSTPKLSMNHSDGKILLGSATTLDLGEGFYADGGGNFRIGDATSGGTDYLKFTASGNLEIKSSDIDITTSNLEVDATELYISTNNQRIALGADGSAVTYDSAGIFLGEDGSGVYKFSVKSASGDSLRFDGAGSLDITGNVTADSGNIGGWTVGSTLSATNILLDPATPKITLGSKATLTDSNTGAYIGTDGLALGASSVFKVTSAGVLTATSATLTGAVTATSGTIAGWDISGDILRSAGADSIDLDGENETITIGSKASLTDGNSGLYLGTDGMALGASSVFKVTSAGALTATSATITGTITATDGLIGGWDIVSNTLESVNSKVILDSTGDGKIRLGSTPPTSHSSGTGIFLGGDGTFLAGDSSASGNKIQFDGSNIVLQSDTFSLKTNTIAMDSTTNSGVIKLGPSGGPGSATGTSNAGAYMDGQGRFNFGDGTGNYIRFNATGLEVNTDNLTIDTSGNLVSTGTINANTGTFGGTSNGWTVATGKIHNSGATGDNDFIGLVHSSQAHSDVGSVSAFYAGADANTGQDANISFGADGKIRGTGTYVRSKGGVSTEFLIGAETVFGGGEDGDLRISSGGSSGAMTVWTDGNTGGTPSHTFSAGETSGNIISPGYGDTMIVKYSSNDTYVALDRDVYLKRFIADISDGSLLVHMNGFRLFASEGIFVYADSGGNGNELRFFDNGNNGGDGGYGGMGGYGNSNSGYVAAAGGTAGTAGTAGAAKSDTNKNLIRTQAGGAGSAGSTGGGVNSSTGNAIAVVDPSTGGAGGSKNDGLGNAFPHITPLSGVEGKSGGAGGASSAGGGSTGGGSAQSTPASSQGNIQWLSTPVDSIVKVRSEFGDQDYAIRLVAGPTNPGSTGGGGGRGDSDLNSTGATTNYQSFGGGGGGGGGGAGSNGGTIMIAAKIVDYWNTNVYSTTTLAVRNPGNNSSQYGSLNMQAVGGNGGNGGNGGVGGNRLNLLD